MSNLTPSKSVEWLQQELESGGTSLLLLDCRSHELYESSHVESAINLAIPGLMLRRFKKGNIPIRTIIPSHEDKEKFMRRCKTDTVVIYDECTVDWKESGAPVSVLGLLLQKLWEDGCKAYYLEGKAPCCRTYIVIIFYVSHVYLVMEINAVITSETLTSATTAFKYP